MLKQLTSRARNLIYKFELNHSFIKTEKIALTLDYEDGLYRQAELIRIIRDSVTHFALTKTEIQKYKENDDFGEMQRKAWERISKARKNSKGDYGEMLLFIILSIFFPSEKFVTKVRLRSSAYDQIKGFDCAHFTVEDSNVVLWLGEAKFHQNFSGAVADAAKSITAHCQVDYLRDEISILGSNIEINETFSAYERINEVLNGGMSLDKIKLRVPVLITYDSSVIPKYDDIQNSAFIEDMGQEFLRRYRILDDRKLTLKPNIEVFFIIIPFDSVASIKTELEKLEEAMR